MAIKIGGDTQYIPKSEQGKPDAAVFTICTLSLQERAEFEGLLSEMQLAAEGDTRRSEVSREIASLSLNVCALGISSITGLVDPQGQPLDVAVAKALAVMADPGLIAELITAITNHNYQSQVAEKNSKRLPKPGQPTNPANTAHSPAKASHSKSKRAAKKRKR